ncbi:5,10-methylenetetrahydrofolate reductase [Treponema sp. JC4]|uniref:methylenetetrahydrofolate reductase [NAD(P)H] n=1 Tax=Treponema sp. JC4 TaxID=1124982 RepID=UPI00025B0A8A|nr:methylenetetrahydrofolate reductase [NAD(P)H] [Treponema sp. JC4]EID84939.1 5,10-methylenetetrahydrofolate reductase [Treponema sp. JC4]
MKISEILKKNEPTLSFEVFPPKTSDKFDTVEAAANQIADLRPHFMSVTYGAAGTTRGFTTEIAASVLKHGATPLAHLTCVNASRASTKEQLDSLKSHGIENILALRGDIPEGSNPSEWEFKHAHELMDFIKQNGDFCVGGACYPEKHPESSNVNDDIRSLKIKQDAGCSFLTTQMFFDNSTFYNFLFKVREAGVTIPVIAGIMPVTNANQMAKIIKLSGAFIPRRYVALLDRWSSDPIALKQAAIAYATDQIIDLIANGVNHIHIYTMNKPEVAAKIQENLSSIIKKPE